MATNPKSSARPNPCGCIHERSLMCTRVNSNSLCFTPKLPAFCGLSHKIPQRIFSISSAHDSDSNDERSQLKSYFKAGKNLTALWFSGHETVPDTPTLFPKAMILWVWPMLAPMPLVSNRCYISLPQATFYRSNPQVSIWNYLMLLLYIHS